MNNKLKINSVFQILSYPYSKEEFTKLEEVSVTDPDVEDDWEAVDSTDEFDEYDKEVVKGEAD